MATAPFRLKEARGGEEGRNCSRDREIAGGKGGGESDFPCC